jgi:hypothetical protein
VLPELAYMFADANVNKVLDIAIFYSYNIREKPKALRFVINSSSVAAPLNT